MKKHVTNRNLQPWLDYFGMLGRFEKEGYLEVSMETREAYVTEAAFNVIAGADGAAGDDILKDGLGMMRRYADCCRSIRAYTAWRDGGRGLKEAFALHVVRDEAPHDLVCTVTIERRRRWTRLWMKADVFDVIDYTG